MIPATIDFLISVTSYALNFKFVHVTSFVLLLYQLSDLPHLKNEFWTDLMNFKLFEHLLV